MLWFTFFHINRTSDLGLINLVMFRPTLMHTAVPKGVPIYLWQWLYYFKNYEPSCNYGHPMQYFALWFLSFFMVALCNRADHYIFMLWFVLLLSLWSPYV